MLSKNMYQILYLNHEEKIYVKIIDNNIKKALKNRKRWQRYGNQSDEVCFLLLTIVPNGWIKANGIAISSTAYVSLYDAMCTGYWAKNDNNTCKIPEFRGKYNCGKNYP